MTLPQTQNKKGIALASATVVAGALLNALFCMVNIDVIKSLFYFDSIFTAIAGALFGPLAGSLCGLATHLILEAFHGWDGTWIVFAPCNVATGLIVGLFARKGRFSAVAEAMLAAVLVAIANALLGAFIGCWFFGGVTTHPSDDLVTSFRLAGWSIIGASFITRVPINLIDKGIATALALTASSLRSSAGRARERAPSRPGR
jgi:energy-coupling factor transport system substrate-specific component